MGLPREALENKKGNEGTALWKVLEEHPSQRET
jgi:hypothetical protein